MSDGLFPAGSYYQNRRDLFCPAYIACAFHDRNFTAAYLPLCVPDDRRSRHHEPGIFPAGSRAKGHPLQSLGFLFRTAFAAQYGSGARVVFLHAAQGLPWRIPLCRHRNAKTEGMRMSGSQYQPVHPVPKYQCHSFVGNYALILFLTFPHKPC